MPTIAYLTAQRADSLQVWATPGWSYYRRGGKAIPGAPDPPLTPAKIGKAYKPRVESEAGGRTLPSYLHSPPHMARSKTLTKTVAIEPETHEKLLAIREAYKLRTLNDAIERLISLLAAK